MDIENITNLKEVDTSKQLEYKESNPSMDLVEETICSVKEYFSSYEDIEIHRLMINDLPRTNAYEDAIFKNKHLFEGKIVMDIGAGTGILSLFMAKAGAKKVYAVEASHLAELIPGVAKDNGFETVIEAVHSRVEEFELPKDESVDVIVSEWMGFYLVHESMLDSVIFARDKFLSSDGIIFPSEAKIYACPCALESLYKEQIEFWDNIKGFNFSVIKNYALKSKSMKPDVRQIKESDLLAEPVCIQTFNLRYITQSDVQQFSSTSFVGINKSGLFQGVAIWFDCLFDGRDYNEDGEEFGNLVTLSTSPLSPLTHWKQTVIVFGNLYQNSYNNLSEGDSNPNYLEEHEVIGWKLDFMQNDINKRNYNITLELLDSDEVEHPVPCQCPMPRCLIIAKMIEKEDESFME